MEGCSERISGKIFTGKDLVFNCRKKYPANKIPSSISGKVQFGFGSGFYGVFYLFVPKLQDFLSAQGGYQVHIHWKRG